MECPLQANPDLGCVLCLRWSYKIVIQSESFRVFINESWRVFVFVRQRKYDFIAQILDFYNDIFLGFGKKERKPHTFSSYDMIICPAVLLCLQ